MKQNIFKITFGAALALMFISQTSCKKNYINPGAPTDQQVFSNIAGLTGVAVGLQRVYTAGRASSLYNRVALNGLLSFEDTVLNQGNTSEYQLERGGGNVDGTNTILGGLWTTSNKIIYDADKVISGLNALSAGVSDKGYVSGLLGYTTIFKALALGDLSMFWEKVPAGIGQNVIFIDRIQGYTKAITAIDAALTAINTSPVSTSFTANVPAGIDIVNTLHALKARYSLFSGNYPQALAEANLVNLAVKSTFNFTTVNLNPIFETATSTNNVYGVHGDTLGLPTSLKPDPNDKRIPFYYTSAYLSKILGFGAASTTPWPVYLPGEMTLIKAEAYARMTTPDLPNALLELNKVVTKLRANDPFGVGAELPPLVGPLTAQQILDQIYKNRCIELFMAGFKLEDERRFGRPTSERKRNFLPYPFLERDNNINTPPDPAF
jgi:hypothetical protein